LLESFGIIIDADEGETTKQNTPILIILAQVWMWWLSDQIASKEEKPVVLYISPTLTTTLRVNGQTKKTLPHLSLAE